MLAIPKSLEDVILKRCALPEADKRSSAPVLTDAQRQDWQKFMPKLLEAIAETEKRLADLQNMQVKISTLCQHSDPHKCVVCGLSPE